MPVRGKLVFLPLFFLLREELLPGHLRKRSCDKITLLCQLQRFSQVFRNPPDRRIADLIGIPIIRLTKLRFVLDAIQPGMNQEGKCKIRVARRICRAQFRPHMSARRRRNPDQLRPVLV